jgi:hypothetical protein
MTFITTGSAQDPWLRSKIETGPLKRLELDQTGAKLFLK